MADSEKMPEQQQLKQKQHQAQVNNHDGLNGDSNLQSSDDTPTQQAKQIIGKFIHSFTFFLLVFFCPFDFVVVKCS